MKNTKYNNRKNSANRHKRRRKTAKNSNLSFAIQMIALTLALCYLAFGIGGPVTSEDVPVKVDSEDVTSATPEANDPMAISEEPHAEPEANTEPIIDENALPLEIHQIDVSCANAYLIRYDGFTIFVDGGQSFSHDDVVKYLDNFGVKSIDCYIATHWHKDHVANMVSILNTYAHERTIVYGTSESPSGKYYVPKGVYTQMVPGTTFNVGDVGFLCVGPDQVTQNGTTNPDSLNILIQYKNFKFLMTGDYMKDAVISMFGELVQNVDVLQMPHHGLSPFCISEGAFSHCNPSTILVPADASKPTHELVESLGMDAQVLDNTNGCIAVVSYGNGYNVYTNVSTPADLK